jgi:hypothetical protein
MEAGKYIGKKTAAIYPICPGESQCTTPDFSRILNEYNLPKEFLDSFQTAFMNGKGCTCAKCCKLMRANLPMLDVPNSFRLGERAGNGANHYLPHVCGSCSPLKTHDIASIVCNMLCIDQAERNLFFQGFVATPARKFCPCSLRVDLALCLKFLTGEEK